jgi:hypothetical protein
MSQVEPSRTEAAPATHNRRLAPRRVPRGRPKVSCYTGPCGLGPNVASSLLDVSESGARLLAREELKPGREVEVGLLGVGHLRPVVRAANVVWCVAAAGGGFCVGVRFQKALPYADLQDLT